MRATCERCAHAQVPLSTDGTHLLDGWRTCRLELEGQGRSVVRRKGADCRHPLGFRALGRSPRFNQGTATGGDEP